MDHSSSQRRDEYFNPKKDTGDLGPNYGLCRAARIFMAYAVRHGYIDYNPDRDAERPRGNGETKEDKIRVLTPFEINSFLDAENDMKYGF